MLSECGEMRERERESEWRNSSVNSKFQDAMRVDMREDPMMSIYFK